MDLTHDALRDLNPAAAASARPRTANGSVAFAALLFILSGACGLAYEVVWTRYLGLFLGNTVLLHTAVLGSFMGGMALGSLLIGKYAERVAHPLKAYGWLELGISIYALAFPALSGAGERLIALAVVPFPPGSLPLLVLRVLLAAALLLPPTLLMGMTFPLLTAHLDRTANMGAGGANWLYFANCTGAVLGTLLTGFVLAPTLGLAATVTGVAIFNAILGAIAMLAGVGSAVSAPAKPRAASQAAPKAQRSAYSAGERLVLFAICLSGATAFSYELVWTRFFAVSLGSSTYSFTLMLAAFITGLALGSVAAQFLPTRRAPLAWLVGAELLIGLIVALSLPLYPRLPYLFWQWKWLLRPTESSLWLYHAFQYGLTFAVMALPTFLFGLTFPTAIRAASASGEKEVASHAAAVYGWNTVGTLVGVLAAGCVLIPMLGLRHTLQITAILNLAIGAQLLPQALGAASAAGKRRLAGVCGGVGVVALGCVLFSPAWPVGALTFGSFRTNVAPPRSWEAYSTLALSRTVKFYKEDFGTTVAVIEAPERPGAPNQLSLVVDGKTDASSHGDLPTQALLGHLPLFMKPGAKDVFILGLGSGVTAGSVLTHPVRRVDCVEISRAVADAAAVFGEANHHALRDPRMHLTLEDGKTFLAACGTTGRKYDVIISEPTNPWISGVANLFSTESFQSAARALKPGGVVAQWFHTYALDDALMATIIRTYRATFPYVTIYQANSTDVILLGSMEPLQPNFAAMEAQFRQAAVGADLSRAGITGVAALLNRQIHTPESAAQLERGGGINSDDLPLLEYRAPHTLYLGQSAEEVTRQDRRFVPGSGLFIEQYLRGRTLTRDEFRQLLLSESDDRMGNPFLHHRLLVQYLERWPNDAKYLMETARLLLDNGRVEQALPYVRCAAAAGDASAHQVAAETERDLRRGRMTAVTGLSAPATP